MEYLYHYTSVEVLALILKYRTIRFNSLNNMDDLQEKETSDITNIGQFCYISSWTENEIESIPMWEMYSSLESGVRIKLKKCPFKTYENTAKSLSKVINISEDKTNGRPLLSIIPLNDIFCKGFFSYQVFSKQEELLHKVEYTDDKEKLYPHILSTNGDTFTIALGKLGKYKNVHWAFQKEWRYILSLLPLNLNQPVENMEKSFLMVGNRIKEGLEKQPFPYYDMEINEEVYNNMEITLSPRISAGNREIVGLLKARYNPMMIVKESELLGLL